MRCRVVALFGVMFLSVMLAGGEVCGESLSGSLTSADGGLDGVGQWVNPGPATISWVITDMGSYYNYEYTLSVPENAKSISHFIVGVSSTFSESNFWNATGSFSVAEIDDFSQANGNPDMPGGLHGLKFDETSGDTLVISFDSDRVPVWGDFYAKGGGNPASQVWNSGFVTANPMDPAMDGSLLGHILVPDTNTIEVPEPITLSLLCVALLGMVLVKRPRSPFKG